METAGENQYTCTFEIEYELYENELRIEMHNGMNFLYLNIHCFRNKLNKFESFLSQLSVLVHVIVLVEINLKEGEMKYFGLENYNCYHSCRKGKSYGGVAMYVHNSVNSQLIVSEQFYFANFLTVELIDLKCKVVGIYNPPDTDKLEFIEYFGNFLDDKKKCYIFGDFNINLLDIRDNTVNFYEDMVEASGFKILNEITENMHTRRSNTICTLIDHVMTDSLSNRFMLYSGDTYLSDHRFLLLNEKLEFTKHTTEKIRKIDYIEVKNRALAMDLETVSFQDFHENLLDATLTCCNEIIVTKKISRFRKPWFRDELRPYMKYRDLFYKLKVKHPANDYYKQQFRYFKEFCEKKLERDKIDHNTTGIKNSLNQPKKLWPKINEIIYNKRIADDSSIKSLKSSGSIITDPKVMANRINDYFVEIPIQLDNLLPDIDDAEVLIEGPEPSMTLSSFSHTDIIEMKDILRNLKKNAASGYDFVTPAFLRDIENDILNFLVKSVNNMLDSGVFPDSLKISKITPVFKDGDKQNVSNYRPIAVLPILSKIFETIIKNRLTQFLSNNNLIHSNQYGFQKNSSTSAAVVNLMSGIIGNLDAKKKTAALFIDLRKAFDCVNHEILLRHLIDIGVGGKAYDLLRNYLLNRKQYTKIGKYDSDLRDIECGVPQGSILGPILFLIYVNGIFDLKLKGKIQLYADDSVLLYAERSFDDLYVSMSSDLRILNKWFTRNRLTMNVEKTKFLTFETKNSTNLDRFDEIWFGKEKLLRVEVYKYLGLWIDFKLDFSTHIKRIRKSVAPIIGVLKRIRPYVIAEILDNLYFAYVHSRLSYMVSIWGMATQGRINSLQVLQNRGIKNLRRLPFRFPTKELYSEKILPVVKLREFEMLLTVHRIIKGKFRYGQSILYRSEIHGYNTRNSHNIQLPFFRMSLGRSSFKYEAFERFNGLPLSVRETDDNAFFKKFVKKKLFDEFFSSP
jgi:exonuclease III